MVTSLHRLFSRRVKARESTSRPHLRRREFGVEQLEIRRYFATYNLDSFSFDGAPIGGWPVIGAGNLVWLSYAIDTENLVLIIPNSVGFICSLSTLLVARRFS